MSVKFEPTFFSSEKSLTASLQGPPLDSYRTTLRLNTLKFFEILNYVQVQWQPDRNHLT